MYSNVMRMTGLNSGMDTESMVRKLMEAEQLKYDKLRQSRQKVEWKQEAYRNVAATLTEYQTNFLNVMKPGSINLPGSFNSMVSKIMDSSGDESDDIRVTSSGSTPVGDMDIVVHSVAAKDIYKGTNISQSTTAKSKVVQMVDDDEDETTPEVAQTKFFKAKDSFTVALDGGAKFTIELTQDDIDSINNAAGIVDSTTFTFDEEDDTAYDAYNDAVADIINSKIQARFGDTVDSAGDSTGIPKLTFTYTGFPEDGTGGEFKLEAAAGHSARMESGDSDKNALDALGFKTAATTGFDMSQSLGLTAATTIEINGKSIELDDKDTYTTLAEKINKSAAGVTLSFNKTRSAFMLESNATGAYAAIDEIKDNSGVNIFGKLGFTLDSANTANVVIDESHREPGGTAKDAVFTANGVTYSREKNNFSVEGVTMTLTEDSEGETYTIRTSRDVTKPKENIQKFVEGYNTLIDALNNVTTTSRPKNGTYAYYEPLTEDQRSAMSEDDIKKWEEKAKTGLLHRDQLVRDITTQLRQWLYEPVKLEDGSEIALYQIGITTSSEASNIGKLQIDDAKLEKALTDRAGAVTELFTKETGTYVYKVADRKKRMPEEGLADRINDIIENTVDSNGGTISERAGIPSTASAMDNELYHDLEEYDDKIEKMLDYLTKREEYYYKMFSRMETAIGESNAQMGSLTGMMGGGA